MSRRTDPQSLATRHVRVAAITGGARGIGLARARAFALEGPAVAIAGIMPVGTFLDETEASTRKQLDVNVIGVLNGVRVILPRFVERRRGHLINVASMAGRTGLAGTATYCGTKHFVVGFSESIRAELQAEGHPVHVSCVMPAVVRTELTDGLGAPRGVAPVTPEQVAEAILDAVRRPRFDVPVPHIAGALVDIATLLPRRATDGMAKITGADHLTLEVDSAKRRGYELRAGGGTDCTAAGYGRGVNRSSKIVPAPRR